MKYLWLILDGPYFSGGYPLCVCRTEEIAMNLCKSDGFKYNKNDDQWDDGKRWREIERKSTSHRDAFGAVEVHTEPTDKFLRVGETT